MKLDTKFSTSRSEHERLERERLEKKVDHHRYGDDGYVIEEEEVYAAPKQPVRRKPASSAPARKPQPVKKKKKAQIGSGFFWLLLMVASCAFAASLWQLQMLTSKIKFLAAAALVLMLFVTGVFTSILSPRNVFQKFVNILLTIAMTVGAVGVPYYEDRVSDLIDTIYGNTVRISLYALTEEYKTSHAPKYENTIEVPEPGEKIKLKNYSTAVYGTFTAIDPDNQNYALGEMEEAFGYAVPYCQDYESARQAAEALYDNKVDILVMSESYVSFIEDVEGYETFSQDTQILYTFVRPIESDLLIKTDANLTKKPYTIFFGGNDEEGELSLQGRTDVDMMVSVNPQTGQIVIISMPRDSFIPNPYFDNRGDKLTHLGIHGLDNTMKGLEKYLDMDIDYYVLVNFTTFMSIIEAIGGVDVDNPYAFDYTWDNYSYPEGMIHLDGQAALYYVRERYNLPDGDFGRSMHQQLVMKAIIRKLLSPALLTNFNGLLTAVEGKFLTNLSSSSLYGLVEYQLDQNVDWNIVNYHLTGSFGYEVTASDPNELAVVYPFDCQVEFVQNVIDRLYNGEILEQEELPDGWSTYGE